MGIDIGPEQLVKLTGRTVTKETVLPRAIYTADQILERPVPNGAIGVIAMLQIFGITGTFAAGEGVALAVKQNAYAFGNATLQVQTSFLTSGTYKVLTIEWYPGAVQGSATVINGDAKITGLPIIGKLVFSPLIRGTFTTGEGIDCQLDAWWLF